MIVELISIGDEIITGHTVDTNSVYIARKLADIGLNVVYKTSVGDDLKHMEEVIYQALKRADVVITTGGLGPTDDDITKRVIVKVFKRNLVFQEDILDDIRRRFEARGIKMPSINQNQALLPQGAMYLANRTGSAVGILIAEEGKIFVSLPGVPREATTMTDEELVPYLKEHIKHDYIRVIKLRTTGIMESALAEKIAPNLKIPESVRFAYLPSYSGVDLRIIATSIGKETADKDAESVANQVQELVGKYIFGRDDETLEAIIGKMLIERKQTLTVAESCTAGLLAGQITSVAGSSEYFDRGVITYSNESKIEMLGVPEKIIEEHGAVSKETVEAMASGLREKFKSDYGISITGIAGPGGGTDEKPVGTVFVAVSSSDGVRSKKLLLGNDREINRKRSVYAALELLRRTILEID